MGSAIVVVVLIVDLPDLTVHITRDQSNHSVAKQSNKYTLKLDTVQSDTNNKPVIHFDKHIVIKLTNQRGLVYAVYNQDGLGWSIWLECLSQKCNSSHVGHRPFELDQRLLTEGQSPRHQSAYQPIKLAVLIGGFKIKLPSHQSALTV